MKSLISFLLILYIFRADQQLIGVDLDNFRNSTDLIESRGFRSETHTVITSDGYILSVFRIINPYSHQNKEKPVIIWHGVGHNSESWLISTEGVLQTNGLYSENNTTLINDCHLTVTSNLAFTLASCGYDVWLPNTRGTEYSRRHQVFDPETNPEYWEYTFTELGVYDAQAVVKHVLYVSGQDSVAYIGHSLGSTSMFILLSLQPDFETYVRPFIALAPFCYMSHMRSILGRIVTKFEENFRSQARSLSIEPSILQFIGIFICANEYFNQMCADLLTFAITGYDQNELNMKRLPVYVSHGVAPFSSWIYAHIGQLIQSGTFSGFDYGPNRNMEVYGTTQPLSYPLSRITSKNIAIYYSLNDYIANSTDVKYLIDHLQVKLLDKYLVPYKEWAHHDFQIGIHQGYYINSRILRLLKSI